MRQFEERQHETGGPAPPATTARQRIDDPDGRPPPHPKVRWGIGVLLGAGVLVNYFDRINLSVGAPQLQQEFGLTDGELGWLFSGFFGHMRCCRSRPA